jgi:hypothetical protein
MQYKLAIEFQYDLALRKIKIIFQWLGLLFLPSERSSSVVKRNQSLNLSLSSRCEKTEENVDVNDGLFVKFVSFNDKRVFDRICLTSAVNSFRVSSNVPT